MAEEQDERIVELRGEDLRALSAESLRRLNEKYGVEVSVRSTRGAIDELLKELAREDIGIIAQGQFTRGFDRSFPGFDRYYDRDITVEFGEEIE